jgi:hypothetical protein
MVLPKLPCDVKSTDTRQYVADESTTKRTSLVTPHRPPPLQLSRTNSISTSPGPLSAPTPTCNTDQSHTYRILPIVAGILIPLSVLLSTPSLTTRWHVQTDGNMTLGAPPNFLYHSVAMSLSLACGVLANICLVLRFSERSIKRMTLLCILLLSMNGSCLPSRLSFLLTDINLSPYKYNYGHCLYCVSSNYGGIRLRTVILDDHLLNGDFDSDQYYSYHRLLLYKRF